MINYLIQVSHLPNRAKARSPEETTTARGQQATIFSTIPLREIIINEINDKEVRILINRCSMITITNKRVNFNCQ